MSEERVLIFDQGHPPLEGHVVDLGFGDYWMAVRYELDPDAVWEVFDYDFAEARPKTTRVVLRPATPREVEDEQEQRLRDEAAYRDKPQTWWRRVLA